MLLFEKIPKRNQLIALLRVVDIRDDTSLNVELDFSSLKPSDVDILQQLPINPNPPLKIDKAYAKALLDKMQTILQETLPR